MKTSILQLIMCFAVNNSSCLYAGGWRKEVVKSYTRYQHLGIAFLLGLVLLSGVPESLKAQQVFPSAAFPLQDINFQGSVRSPNTQAEPGITGIFVQFDQDNVLDLFVARFRPLQLRFDLEYYQQDEQGVYQLVNPNPFADAATALFDKQYLTPSAADIDGDGDQDLLIGYLQVDFFSNPQSLQVLYLRNDNGQLVQDDANNPFGFFNVATTLPSTTVSPGILDENGDGVPEAAFLSYIDGSGPQVKYYTFNTNSRDFEEAENSNPLAGEVFNGMINATFVDLDNDSDQDLAVGVVRDGVLPSDSTFRYYENQAGTYVWQRGETSPFARLLRDFTIDGTPGGFRLIGRSPRFDFGDYSNDGKPDLLYGDFFPTGFAQGEVFYYHNNGEGNQPSYGRIIGDTAFQKATFTMADLNLDNVPDLLFKPGDFLSTTPSAGTFINDGLGSISSNGIVTLSDTLYTIFSDGAQFLSPQWFDFDLDGDLDFFVTGLDEADANGVSYRTFINDGNNNYTSPAIYQLDMNSPVVDTVVSLGAFLNEADTNFIPSQNSRFENIGISEFSADTDKGFYYTGFFDIDEDDVLECVFAFTGDSLTYYKFDNQQNTYVEDQANNPLDAATLNLPTGSSLSIGFLDPVFIDYDLDGDDDLFLKYVPRIDLGSNIRANAQKINYYEFDAGTFTLRDDLNPLRNFYFIDANGGNTIMNFADTDQDGDLDLYINLKGNYVEEFINESRPEVSLLINQDLPLASGDTVFFDRGVTRDTTILVRNDGLSNLTLTNADIAGSGYSIVSVPQTIAPKQTGNLVINYTASMSESLATLTFQTNDTDEKNLTIQLSNKDASILSVRTNGMIIPENSTLDFGSLVLNTSKDTLLRLFNSGNIALNINEITLSGNDFTLVESPSGNSVAPGDSTSLLIRFTAGGDPQDLSSTLTINNTSSNAGAFTLNLTGARTPVTSAEEIQELDFRMGPVPSERYLNLYLENFPEKEVLIQLYDAYGKRVAEQRLDLDGSNNIRSLDLSNLSPGAYVLRMISGDREAVRQFIVK